MLNNTNALSNHPIHLLKRGSNEEKNELSEDVGYLGIVHPPVSDNLTSLGGASTVQGPMGGMPLSSNYFRRAHKLQALNHNLSI